MPNKRLKSPKSFIFLPNLVTLLRGRYTFSHIICFYLLHIHIVCPFLRRNLSRSLLNVWDKFKHQIKKRYLILLLFKFLPFQRIRNIVLNLVDEQQHEHELTNKYTYRKNIKCTYGLTNTYTFSMTKSMPIPMYIPIPMYNWATATSMNR